MLASSSSSHTALPFFLPSRRGFYSPAKSVAVAKAPVTSPHAAVRSPKTVEATREREEEDGRERGQRAEESKKEEVQEDKIHEKRIRADI